MNLAQLIDGAAVREGRLTQRNTGRPSALMAVLEPPAAPAITPTEARRHQLADVCADPLMDEADERMRIAEARAARDRKKAEARAQRKAMHQTTLQLKRAAARDERERAREERAKAIARIKAEARAAREARAAARSLPRSMSRLSMTAAVLEALKSGPLGARAVHAAVGGKLDSIYVAISTLKIRGLVVPCGTLHARTYVLSGKRAK